MSAALIALVLMGNGLQAHAGLTITPTFDSSITSDPNAAAIEGTINTAIKTYENTFSNPINVTINFQEMNSGLGQSVKNLYLVPYATFRNTLAAQPQTADVMTALAHLPVQTNNPVTGDPNMALSTANIKALGLGTLPGPNGYDGIVSLNTHITTPGSGGGGPYSLLATVEHEINEVLGLGSSLSQSFSQFPQPEDLYRYDGSGSRSYTTNASAKAYFSLDGTTKLAQFDNQNDGGDRGDWQSNPLPPGVAPKVQDAFATAGAHPTLGVELRALNVIGYSYSTTVPEPSTVSLLGTGLMVLSGYGWSRCRQRPGRTVA